MSKQKLAALLILSGSWLVALGCSVLPNLFAPITWEAFFGALGG